MYNCYVILLLMEAVMYNHIGMEKIKSFSFLDDLRSERGGKETLNSGYIFQMEAELSDLTKKSLL